MTLDAEDLATIAEITRRVVHERLTAFGDYQHELFRPVGEAVVSRCEQLNEMERSLRLLLQGQCLIEKHILPLLQRDEGESWRHGLDDE